MKQQAIWKLGLAALAAMMLLQTVTLSAQEDRKVKRQVQPSYPQLAKQMHVQGSVKLQVTIAPSGKVQSVNVIGGHPLLIDSATQAMKGWQYEPAAETTTATVVFNFSE